MDHDHSAPGCWKLDQSESRYPYSCTGSICLETEVKPNTESSTVWGILELWIPGELQERNYFLMLYEYEGVVASINA